MVVGVTHDILVWDLALTGGWAEKIGLAFRITLLNVLYHAFAYASYTFEKTH